MVKAGFLVAAGEPGKLRIGIPALGLGYAPRDGFGMIDLQRLSSPVVASRRRSNPGRPPPLDRHVVEPVLGPASGQTRGLLAISSAFRIRRTAHKLCTGS